MMMMMMMMMMCVCVDIAPGMYLCVLHVLMECSLCYILPYGAPPSLCETGTYMIPGSGFVAPPPRMGWVHPGEGKEAVG